MPVTIHPLAVSSFSVNKNIRIPGPLRNSVFFRIQTRIGKYPRHPYIRSEILIQILIFALRTYENFYLSTDQSSNTVLWSTVQDLSWRKCRTVVTCRYSEDSSRDKVNRNFFVIMQMFLTNFFSHFSELKTTRRPIIAVTIMSAELQLAFWRQRTQAMPFSQTDFV